MRRILFAMLLTCYCATIYGQGTTGEFTFTRVSIDTNLAAKVTIGWDYVKVVKIIKDGPLKGYTFGEEVWGSSPNYNFSFDDYGGFWISRKSTNLKLLARFSTKKQRYTYIRINGTEYRE